MDASAVKRGGPRSDELGEPRGGAARGSPPAYAARSRTGCSWIAGSLWRVLRARSATAPAASTRQAPIMSARWYPSVDACASVVCPV